MAKKLKRLVKGSLAAKRHMAKLRRLAIAARKKGPKKKRNPLTRDEANSILDVGRKNLSLAKRQLDAGFPVVSAMHAGMAFAGGRSVSHAVPYQGHRDQGHDLSSRAHSLIAPELHREARRSLGLRRNPLLMTVMGNPGGRRYCSNPGHSDATIARAARDLGYSPADVSRVIREHQATGELPTMLEAALRYSTNPSLRHSAVKSQAWNLLVKIVGGQWPPDEYDTLVARAKHLIRNAFGSSIELGLLMQFTQMDWTPDTMEDFTDKVYRTLGKKSNPGRLRHERIASRSRFQRGSFRTIRRGAHRIVVGRPHGSTKTRAVSILHPEGNPRRPTGAFDVYLNGKLIDTVFYTESQVAAGHVTTDEVKRSLVNHDGYDPGITVRMRWRKENPIARGPHGKHQYVQVEVEPVRLRGNSATVTELSKGANAISIYVRTALGPVEWLRDSRGTSPREIGIMMEEAKRIAKELGGIPVVAPRLFSEKENPHHFGFVGPSVSLAQRKRVRELRGARAAGSRGAARLLRKYDKRKAAKNPGPGRRRKVTMTLEAFAKQIKARKDPALWKAFCKKIEQYKKWSHGTLPKKVVVEQVDVPGMSGVWMTYDAGKAPETAYVMPRGTKRKGAWVHEWDSMPDLKNDPDSGIVLTKLKGRSRITDFYHR